MVLWLIDSVSVGLGGVSSYTLQCHLWELPLTSTVISAVSCFRRLTVADPDFEQRSGPGFVSLALPAFLPSIISSFFTQNNGGPGLPGPLL